MNDTEMCEYHKGACPAEAHWLIDNPPSWSRYVCDEHVGPMLLEETKSVILFEVTPIGSNPRVYQRELVAV